MPEVCDRSAAKLQQIDAGTYKVRQAADRAQVSYRQMWRWIDAKLVPGVIRRGRVVRISKALFDAWLNGGTGK